MKTEKEGKRKNSEKEEIKKKRENRKEKVLKLVKN